MNKNKFKRVLSIALATVIVAGTIAFTPQGASEVQAAPTASVKNINLGTAGLANTGSKVYFGLDTSSTIPKVNSDNTITSPPTYTKTTANNLWRVLDASSGLLFANDIIAERRYDDDSNAWNSSELKSWLNGAAYKTNSNKFSKLEQGAIATNTDGNMRLLTIDEVKNTAYGFTNDENHDAIRAARSWWWLRSSGASGVKYAVVGLEAGSVNSNGFQVDYYSGSVRPAFNLKLDSVLFSSASSAGKSSFAEVGEDWVSTNIWKLTLKDSSKTVSVTSGQSVSKSAQTITIPYTYTGRDVSQISIMITDKAYTESDASILYYGALNTTLATTGTGTFTLPSGLPDGYKIYMMAEDVNEATLTDYSSVPVEIVPNVPPTSNVTITNPTSSHITLSTATGNGAETQNGLTGAMTSVVYTADDGYYFPTTYTVTGSNGITVTRDDYTQITVSGTPTADASITLEAATEKKSQEAPSVTDGVDKISGTTTAMEYASSESAATWTTCSDGNTTVAAGTWYVRYAATDTKKAGTAASVEVTTTPLTPTTYAVMVNNGTGDGSYAAGATVTITADAAPSGQEFDTWTVVSGEVTLASATNATTTFVMPASAVEVTATYKNKASEPNPPAPAPEPTPNPPAPTPTYTITTGAGGTYELSTDGTLTITCDGALDKLTGIYVNDKLVDAANYTLRSGSTILTFKASYLNTLSVGTYKVKFQYSDESAETTFVIKEASVKDTSTQDTTTQDTSTQDTTTQNTTAPSKKDDVPKTGDNTPIAWLFMIAVISGACVCYFGRKKKTVR